MHLLFLLLLPLPLTQIEHRKGSAGGACLTEIHLLFFPAREFIHGSELDGLLVFIIDKTGRTILFMMLNCSCSNGKWICTILMLRRILISLLVLLLSRSCILAIVDGR